MTLAVSVVGAAVIGLAVLYVFKPGRSSVASLPLPPGPPRLPLIGNVHQAPKSHGWLQFTAWGREFGPVFYLNMLGQHVVVLSTGEAAHDLLAKKGATFSDRPKMFVAQELALKNMNVLLMDYHERFRMRQRLENMLLNNTVAAKYRGFQTMESKQLLFDLMKNAGGAGVDVHSHFERLTASDLFALFYGFRLKDAQEPELVTSMALNEEFSAFVRVGAFLVDSFPALNILPGPLAPWKKMAESHHQRKRAAYNGNFERGLKFPAWTFAKQMHKTVQEEKLTMSFDELAFEFGTLVDAALDGTVETMVWFLIACITQDHGFVEKARRQLDAVVGRDRLPTFEDEPKLLYIRAILEELLRWRPIAAGGVPHYTNVESIYKGNRIPAGSVVIANHWAITRDEAVYGPDPDSFVPERWIGPETAETGQIKDLPVVGFGYGRRTCPGRHFGRNILWISMAQLLWAFDIQAGLDEETGKPVAVDANGSIDGLVMRPLPFKARLTPRDQQAHEIIERECQTHGEDLVAVLTEIGESLTRK